MEDFLKSSRARKAGFSPPQIASKLKKLELKLNKITPVGAIAIADYIRGGASLTYLG